MAGSRGLDLITRKDAIEEGRKFFFVGKECKRGHTSLRFVSNYACYECSKSNYYATLKTDKYKQARKAQTKREYQSNKDRYFFNNAKRRALAKQATPVWLTEEQKKDIRNFYKERPEGYHVDHIVPLRGCNVCGLNVRWNLQYLKSSDNLTKSNKL